MNNVIFYLATLAIFFFINNILVWGLNIQFGYTGILNFAFIVFMAVGAYVAGVTALPPATSFAGQTYVAGFSWPWPLPLLAAGIVAAAYGVLVGFIALKRLRSDYMAIVTVAVAGITYDIIGNYFPLFNGWDGIAGVPAPLQTTLQINYGVDYYSYQFVFLILAGIVMLILGFIAQRLYYSPFGRTLRSIREDMDVSEAFGKDTYRYRMIAMAIGCFYAGVAGALTMEYIQAFNPSGWTTGETFILFAALIIGGTSNNWGAALGALLVPVIFQEATRYLPQIGSNPEFIPAMRNVIVGGLLILTLWFRPQGLIPERKAKFNETPLLEAENTQEEANVAAG